MFRNVVLNLYVFWKKSKLITSTLFGMLNSVSKLLNNFSEFLLFTLNQFKKLL